VPARGLNGEAYRGHVFWDELYVLPFLTFRLPDGHA
jgi:trehalose/maltose hydrolase-like predicted phosphorylase